MSKLVYPDYYNNSILNTITSVLKKYDVETEYNSLNELDKVLEKNYKNVVFIVLDGMGEKILNGISLDGFFNKNKIKTVTSVYPSATVAALTTYYSGLPPYASGWVAWSQYFKDYGRAVDMFSQKESYERNEINKSRKNVFKDVVSYETIFEKIEKKGIKAVEITPSYSSARGKISLRADTVDDSLDMVEFISSAEGEKFIFVYIDNPDGLLHKYGCGSDEVKEFVLEVQNKIERLSEKLSDSLIIVTADHGQKNIEKVYSTIDDEELFEMYQMPPTLESRAVAYYIKDNKKKEFKERFEMLYKDDFLLLSKEEVLEKGILGYGKKHKRLEDFIGDFLAISISDSIMRLETFLAEGKPVKRSTHCGLTEDEMLVPVIAIECNKK